MKILIKAHVVTAILGWIIMLAGAIIVISEEGSLPAALSLCLMGVVTAITIVDLLSVYFAKKQQPPVCLPFPLSFGEWLSSFIAGVCFLQMSRGKVE